MEGRHLAARYNYRIPMSKSLSLIWILGIAFVAALICICTDIFFKKNPEKKNLKEIEYKQNKYAEKISAVPSEELAKALKTLLAKDKEKK